MTTTNHQIDPKSQTEPQTSDVWTELAANDTPTTPETTPPAEPPVTPAAASLEPAATAESTATPTIAKAKGAAKKPRGSKGTGKRKPAPRQRSGGRKPAVTLKDIGDGYIASLQAREASPGTLFSYTMELRLAADQLGEDTSAKKLTAKMIEAFFESDRVTKKRNGKAKAKPSIDKTRRVLRQALLWAEEAGLIEKAPVEKPARKKARASS